MKHVRSLYDLEKLAKCLTPIVLLWQGEFCVPTTPQRLLVALDVALCDMNLHLCEAAMLFQHLLQFFFLAGQPRKIVNIVWEHGGYESMYVYAHCIRATKRLPSVVFHMSMVAFEHFNTPPFFGWQYLCSLRSAVTDGVGSVIEFWNDMICVWNCKTAERLINIICCTTVVIT